MADRRGILVPLLIIAFIFLPSNPGRAPTSRFDDRPRIEDVIVEEQRSLAVLLNSSYGDLNGESGRLLNLTGLEPDRGFAWEALPKVRQRAQEQLEYALGGVGGEALQRGGGGGLDGQQTPLYKNVTGFVHGGWVRSVVQDSVSIPQLNLSRYAPVNPFGPTQPNRFGGMPLRHFGRNVTGSDGDVRIRFHEKEPTHGLGGGSSGLGNATRISAEMTIWDTKTGDESDVQLHGVYDIAVGQAIMTTTSEKFAGIFMLPQFLLSQHAFATARTVLNDSIARTISRQETKATDSLNPWTANIDGTTVSPFDTPDCEVIVYLQQLPPTGTTAAYSFTLLSFLERELRYPTGASLPSAPELRFSMLAFSPDCGYVLESKGEPAYAPQEGGKHLTGPKIEVLYQRGRYHLFVFTLIVGAQIVLLTRQMREACTPSTRSRISLSTIAMLALGDNLVGMTLLLLGLSLAGLWVNLMTTAFLTIVSASFIGMKFLMDIWMAQAPERERQAREEAEEQRRRLDRIDAELERIRGERRALMAERERRAAEVPAAPVDGNDAGIVSTPAAQPVLDVPPLPVTASTPTDADPAPALLPQATPGSLPSAPAIQRPIDTGATPVFMPSDQEGLEPVTQPTPQTNTLPAPRMAGFAYLYVRFYLLLLGTFFFTLTAITWPPGLRRFYFTTVGLAYLSFWTPQIYRNVQRNCRRALEWEFVGGQSLLRLVPFAYFYGYGNNVLFAERDYYSLALLALWLWVQLAVLGSQELLGPRWFVRKDWAPPAYDYHPVLREDEEGATMPIGFAEAAAEDSSAPTSPLLERQNSNPGLVPRRTSIAKEARPREKGRRMFDCAICMQELEVPVIEAGGSRDTTLAGGLLGRRNYMVTPCRHIFHSVCLEGWMKYRLQCPICRETLPSL